MSKRRRMKMKKKPVKKARRHHHVPVPKGHVPVLAVHEGAVKVIPVKKRTFMDWLTQS